MENHIPFDLDALPPWWKCRERIILYCVLLPVVLITPAACGFDSSMTNSLQTIPGFQDQFNHPSGATLGFFGAAQSIGGILATLIGPWIGDKFGRRFPVVIGDLFIIGSTFGQTWALSFGMFCAFKVSIGIGIGLIQIGAAPLVAELAHPKERVALTNLYNTAAYLGGIIGAWVTFGTYTIESNWSWRIPCLLQIVCSIYQVSFIFLCPESPRWLVANGSADKAKALLTKYHGGGDPNNELVEWEFAEIVEAINYEKANKVPIKELISDRGLMWRAFICISCGVFSQTSGNGLISTYLSTILVSAGITDAKDIVTINGSISIWSWIVGVGCAIFTSRLKRRTVFLTGLTTMLIIFIGWTVAQAQYDMHGVKAAGYAVIAIVFLYNAAYAYSLLYLVVAYPIEIAPYRWRVRMWSLTLLAISIAAFFNSYVNPIGLQNIGWKYYIYYDVWIACEIAIVYFWFPETSGRTLEEIAVVFDGEKAAITGNRDKAGIKDEKDGDAIDVSHSEKGDSDIVSEVRGVNRQVV